MANLCFTMIIIMNENCIYNTFYKVFAKLTKAKSSLITYIYLNFLESFDRSLLLLKNPNYIVYLNIKKIQLFYIKSKLFLHQNKFKIPGITICGR